MDIENYKDLLIAIFNTEKECDKKSVICVYDTKENDKLIAIFNSSKSCGKFFGTSYRAIDCSICKKYLRNNRYRLERVIIGE
jgi:hypothetical protein